MSSTAAPAIATPFPAGAGYDNDIAKVRMVKTGVPSRLLLCTDLRPRCRSHRPWCGSGRPTHPLLVRTTSTHAVGGDGVLIEHKGDDLARLNSERIDFFT